MSEPVPSGFTLTPLQRVTARLAVHDWAWARAQTREIARNWQRRRAERPALFDGTVLLAHACRIRSGHCEVSFFEVPYSHFLAFRDAGSPDPEVANAFAAIVPQSADGAILLGEMAPHTANAGQIYFPCGTPDRADVREDGSVDLALSAARELAEETGLALPEGWKSAPWLLVRGDGQLAFLRPVRFASEADAIVAAVEAHRRTQASPELARLVMAWDAADIDAERMPGFARAYLRSIDGGAQR